MSTSARRWNVRDVATAFVRDYPYALHLRAQASIRRRPPRTWGTGTARPVLLIPGVYETWHFLRPIAAELSRRGHPVHVVKGLGINRLPIPRSAALVAEHLADADLRGLAIVAHSKGGLIGKHLLVHDDPDGRIDRLVAIASPFGGSSMARFLPTRDLRIFLPTDPIVTALAAEAEANARITSIAPRFDPHIPEGSHLEGARNVEVPVVGHFGVLRSRSVLRAVLDAVEQEQAPEPVAASATDAP